MLSAKINPELETSLLEKRAELEGLGISDIKVRDDETYQTAGVILTEIKTQQKDLTAEKKKVTGPLKEISKTIDGWFKGPLAALKAAEAHLKGEMQAFDRKKEEERRKAIREAAKAAKSGDSEAATDALRKAGTLSRQKVEGVSSRVAYEIQIVDESLIPREYLKVDEAAIKKAARESRGKEKIPGVVIIETSSIAVRSR